MFKKVKITTSQIQAELGGGTIISNYRTCIYKGDTESRRGICRPVNPIYAKEHFETMNTK